MSRMNTESARAGISCTIVLSKSNRTCFLVGFDKGVFVASISIDGCIVEIKSHMFLGVFRYKSLCRRGSLNLHWWYWNVAGLELVGYEIYAHSYRIQAKTKTTTRKGSILPRLRQNKKQLVKQSLKCLSVPHTYDRPVYDICIICFNNHTTPYGTILQIYWSTQCARINLAKTETKQETAGETVLEMPMS